MKRRAILLVGGGMLQIPAVEIAKEDLGLYTIVTDKNPECPCASIADEFISLDTKDAYAHILLAVELKSKDNNIELTGVFTQGNSVEYTVASFAQVAGLPRLNPSTAYTIANKAQMRLALSLAHIPQPRYDAFSRFQDAKKYVQFLDCPIMVKPTDNSGSRGTTKVYSSAEFTPEVFDRAQNVSSDHRVLIEELLTAVEDEIPEQSVETVWENGKGYWLNWVDRPFFRGDKKYAIELGHYNPAMHDPKTQKQVEDMVMAAGRALRMTTGIFKCDVLLTKDGPRILETTARLSGGFDAQYTSPLAHGVEYIRGAMRMALGESVPWEDFLPKLHRHAVALSAFPKPGRITAIYDYDSAWKIKGIEYIFPRVKVGDVIPPYTDCTVRPLFVIASGDTRQEAIGAAQQALDIIQIETEAICAH